jgi:hypothetical protein
MQMARWPLTGTVFFSFRQPGHSHLRELQGDVLRFGEQQFEHEKIYSIFFSKKVFL